MIRSSTSVGLFTISVTKSFLLVLVLVRNSLPYSICRSGNGLRISNEYPNGGQSDFDQTIFPATFQNIAPLSNADDPNSLIVRWGDVAAFTITRVNSECSSYEFTTTTDDPLTASFNISAINLYGGATSNNQTWPIEFTELVNDPYVSLSSNGQGLLQTTWYTSNGLYVQVDDTVPLFLNLNTSYFQLTARRDLPYIRGNTTYLLYKICKYPDVKTAVQRAINDSIGRPTGPPDFLMSQRPIWSTWVIFKRNINEQKILSFANDINRNGLPNSQLEIDDRWETCYGSFEVDTSRFPNMTQLVQTLKGMGFRVTLWVHPFVNAVCDPYYTTGVNNDYFVKTPSGSVQTMWWNGRNASLIDYTNPAAANWWYDRLVNLRNQLGIDSYKVDAGESSYGPQPSVFQNMSDIQPDTSLKEFIKTASRFGSMVEVRTGRNTQQYPIYMRMNDRASEWTGNASLATLIPTLLLMNIIGYPFVLPDMIAGNQYENENIAPELFLRWLELSLFMPSIQFSIFPAINDEVLNTTKNFLQMRSSYAGEIYELMTRASETGEPVNPPIWWIDPLDPVTYDIHDEYLLGESLLVAPVTVQGATSRDIYLPRGVWEDRSYNRNNTIQGPVWLRNYSAPVDILPYFAKIG